MALVWHPLGALAVVEAVVLLAVGLGIFLAGPRRWANRWLALTLGVQAFADATFPMTTLFADDAATTEALVALNWVASCAAVFVYLAFLGAALDTPLVRPWATRRRQVATFALGVALAAALVALPGPVPAPVSTAILALAVLCFLYGLVAAVDAWRRAPAGSLRRRRSGAYARAFGFRDAAFIGIIAAILVVDFQTQVLLSGALLLAQLVYVALLAHAILRDHLFDIDLRVKWTLRRGTVAAIFLAAFFVVFAIAEQYLERFGFLVGGVAIGLLLFALRPIERLAERLSDRAMPRVRDTEEYRSVRKREVYRAAIESALADGVVTDKERDVLATLADQLGIGAKEALDIEREVTTRSGDASTSTA